MAGEWNPDMDAAPKDGSDFLAWVPKSYMHPHYGVLICYWDTGGERFTSDQDWTFDSGYEDTGTPPLPAWLLPTHWMPLPEPPK